MYNNRKMRLISALLVSVSLSACAIGSDYTKPDTALPEQWPWTAEAEGKIPQDVISKTWWNEFKDPALSALVEEGLQANADLLIAASRVARARALLTSRQADLYPTIDVQAGASRVKNSEESAAGATNSKPFNDLNLGAVLSYELDLWGRLRRSNESARAQLLASQASRDAVQLAVVSNIALGYFNLRALDAQIAITNNTIASRTDALDFQRKQYDMGGENALTFHQAEAELAAAQAQKPLLEQSRAEQETALAVLLGRSPRDIVQGTVAAGKSIDGFTIIPLIPGNLPSTLLERRPDISASEQSLIAANADIAVAKADYFPRVSLSALLGLASSDADDLLRGSARRWQAGAGLTAPLLDFGRTASKVDAAEAAKDEAMANYEQTVRVAFKEVLDALSAEKTSATREKAQVQQMKSRAETVRLSDLRYKSGYSNYLELLDAQRFLHQAQLDRVAARRDRLIATVNLYRALGGGWGTDGQRGNIVPTTVIMQDRLTHENATNSELSTLEPVAKTEIAVEPARVKSIGDAEGEMIPAQAPQAPIADTAKPPAPVQPKQLPPVVKPTPMPESAPVKALPPQPAVAPAPVQEPMRLPAEMM